MIIKEVQKNINKTHSFQLRSKYNTPKTFRCRAVMHKPSAISIFSERSVLLLKQNKASRPDLYFGQLEETYMSDYASQLHPEIQPKIRSVV